MKKATHVSYWDAKTSEFIAAGPLKTPMGALALAAWALKPDTSLLQPWPEKIEELFGQAYDDAAANNRSEVEFDVGIIIHSGDPGITGKENCSPISQGKPRTITIILKVKPNPVKKYVSRHPITFKWTGAEIVESEPQAGIADGGGSFGHDGGEG